MKDIFSITSLGFRGEAVPSIAAVSELVMTTRMNDTDLAFRMVLSGGSVKEEEHTGASVGTTMEVRNLFFNTPARKKFMKSEPDGKFEDFRYYYEAGPNSSGRGLYVY